MPVFAQKIIHQLQRMPSAHCDSLVYIAAADILSIAHVKGYSTGGLFPELDHEGATVEEADTIRFRLNDIVSHSSSPADLAAARFALEQANRSIFYSKQRNASIDSSLSDFPYNGILPDLKNCG
ncbi:MAG TPA: hypothetical protein VKC60_10455 [Opitutaceae bacterium]|nr:hypothetical protein [Opitutaceae bacterium]